jgi:hypothetical protein
MTAANTVPTKVAEYFGSNEVGLYETFNPEHSGWLRAAPRITRTTLRELRAQGITRVSFRCGNRVADFAIDEVC